MDWIKVVSEDPLLAMLIFRYANRMMSNRQVLVRTLEHAVALIGSQRLIKLTEISAMQLSVLTYLAMLVGVFALGYAINWMARTYGAKEEHVPSNGIALAAYSCTPLFLAGFALLYPVPWFNAIVFLAAACYGAYLMYDGLPIVMGIEKERAVMYAGALLTVALVILVSTRVGSVILWNFGVGPVFISG